MAMKITTTLEKPVRSQEGGVIWRGVTIEWEVGDNKGRAVIQGSPGEVEALAGAVMEILGAREDGGR